MNAQTQITATTRIYAACLASYNNGALHGAWIDASSDADEMQEAVNTMLRASPYPNVTVECPDCEGDGKTTFHNSETGETRRDACPTCRGAGTVPSAEEYAIHDYDDSHGALRGLGEYPGLDTVAAIMGAVEEIEDDYDDSVLPHLFAWLADHQDDPAFWKSDLDDAFAGIWKDPEDYAAQLAEDCGELETMPEHIARYIDFQAMARDMALGGEIDFICTSTGQHLQDYDSMRGRECIALRNL